jgi:hypothetical protein
MTQLIKEISDCPKSGLKRKLHFEEFKIKKDFNMAVQWKTVYYENIDGEYGLPMYVDRYTPNAIDADSNLSTDQKNILKRQYQPVIKEVDTSRGFKVNAVTGEPDEDGILELHFWQSIGKTHPLVSEYETVFEMVYAMIGVSGDKINSRNQV